jgi:hypothetical protein
LKLNATARSDFSFFCFYIFLWKLFVCRPQNDAICLKMQFSILTQHFFSALLLFPQESHIHLVKLTRLLRLARLLQKMERYMNFNCFFLSSKQTFLLYFCWLEKVCSLQKNFIKIFLSFFVSLFSTKPTNRL